VGISNDGAVSGARATAQSDGHAASVEAFVDFHTFTPLSDSVDDKEQCTRRYS
jgi:hypothetical protein